MNDFHLYDLFNIITLINHFKNKYRLLVTENSVSAVCIRHFVLCISENVCNSSKIKLQLTNIVTVLNMILKLKTGYVNLGAISFKIIMTKAIDKCYLKSQIAINTRLAQKKSIRLLNI